MPRRPSFAPKENPAKEGTGSAWYVVTPSSMTSTGTLKRTFFPTETDAETFAQKLRAQYHKGLRGVSITPILAHQASNASKVLAPHGATLVEAAKAYAEVSKILEPFGVSPVEAAKSYASRMKGSGATETFEDRYWKFLEANEDRWSDRYRRDMEKLRDKLPPEFRAQLAGDIGPEEIRIAASYVSKGETEIANRSRMIRAALNCKTKAPQRKPPKIYSAKQVTALLEACQTPEETRAVGMMLFAGIRPDAEDGEISKLLWEDVRGRHIYVRSEVAKTKVERLVVIRPRLIQILKGKPKAGLVVPAQWKKVIQRIRRDAGIDGTEYQDAARHTFGSCHLVAYGEERTKEAMGHAADSRTLFRHYRRAVTQSRAKAYFK